MDCNEIIKERQEDFENIYINSKKYENIKKLGGGSFGTVYLVVNESRDKNYAIKHISIENKPDNYIEIIENEVNILKSIEDNNHIIKYYDSGKDKDNRYFNILMEYCNGPNLNEFINDYKKKGELIDESIIHDFILDICLGIKAINERNIIHRDLKPANLFLTRDKKIKIGDFGISRQLVNQSQFASSFVGTSNYMAPEMINNQYEANNQQKSKYNSKVDIWAFGCIIYELVTLEFCFKNVIDLFNKTNNKNNRYVNIDTQKYDYKWQELIDFILEKDYSKRPNIDEIYTQIIRISNKMKRISEKEFENKILEKMEKKQIYRMKRMKCN